MGFEPIKKILPAFATRHKLSGNLRVADICSSAALIMRQYGVVRSYKRKILTIVVADHKHAQLARENEQELKNRINTHYGQAIVSTFRIVVEPR